MDPETLFGMARGLTPPWYVSRIACSASTSQMDIHLGFAHGSTFRCPVCGVNGAKTYDTTEEAWRHLHVFQYAAYLRGRFPSHEALPEVLTRLWVS